ncbi:winged helix-turn-helix domain-containing protein [Belnapia sp. T6]|uniref:Winged helix-turn-helix domain-containing protein n=1 Tax=Belnapia mucosa TaxID=2804532 RepID=A0ABS1V2Q5_9PROT|nr:helix-turn-helix domain-containing protein [Belnapia mucosa]MBL6454568.1 winged helix-turn-helix domain-containing protein [Belnapia mucosa]
MERRKVARWVLMAHDRTTGNDEFPMTHEFLAMMLGVRRARVTIAAGQLQKAGLIHDDQGCIEVTHRPGLESAACECYGVVRRAQDQMLGSPLILKATIATDAATPQVAAGSPPHT